MMIRKILVTALMVSAFAATGSSLFAAGEIGSQLKVKEPVPVYVSDFANPSNQSQITPAAFKKAIEKSLSERKSLTFKIVPTAAESQIQIKGIINIAQYLDKGPLKVTPDLGMIAIDAVQTATGNYVEMEAEFTVLDTQSGKTLWKDMINVYLKKAMKPEESFPLITDKIIKSFMKNCFGKPKK